MNNPRVLAGIINKDCDQYLPNLLNELLKFKCDILLYNDPSVSSYTHENRHLPEVQVERLRNIGEARQAVVEQFLAGDWTHLWWVDADFKSIPEGTLEKLLNFKVPVVCPIQRLEDGTLYDLGTTKDGKTADELAGDLIEVNFANATCLIEKEVFYCAEINYLTDGTIQEGGHFSQMCRMNNVPLYASLQTTIYHHTIIGNKKL